MDCGTFEGRFLTATQSGLSMTYELLYAIFGFTTLIYDHKSAKSRNHNTRNTCAKSNTQRRWPKKRPSNCPQKWMVGRLRDGFWPLFKVGYQWRTNYYMRFLASPRVYMITRVQNQENITQETLVRKARHKDADRKSVPQTALKHGLWDVWGTVFDPYSKWAINDVRTIICDFWFPHAYIWSQECKSKKTWHTKHLCEKQDTKALTEKASLKLPSNCPQKWIVGRLRDGFWPLFKVRYQWRTNNHMRFLASTR